MFGFVRRWLDRRRCKKMGLKGMSVGVRADGTLDVEVEEEDGWNFSNLKLEEAEFMYEELGRGIARQKERGFPKLEGLKLIPPSEAPSSEKSSEP